MQPSFHILLFADDSIIRAAMADVPETRTVVCLKWGRRYPAEYVNRLYRGVSRHLRAGFCFICFTEDASGILPEVQIRNIDALAAAEHMRRSVWLKLALLHPRAELQGRCLYLDLDLIILDSLEAFFSRPGEFYIIHNWIERRKLFLRARPDIGNSSVFRFEAGKLPEPLERYLADPEHAQRSFPTEQAFLTHVVGARKQYWPEEWVRSFKYHCRPIFPLNWIMCPRLPGKVRILGFHGRPDPDQAIAGYVGRKWHHRTLPCPQLAEHWR